MYSRRTNKDETIEGAVHTLIPIILVIVEGGRSSIKTVCEALDSNTPVVVVKVKQNIDVGFHKTFFIWFKESGRAADLIADLCACFFKDLVDCPTYNDNAEDTKHAHISSFAQASSRIAEINVM